MGLNDHVTKSVWFPKTETMTHAPTQTNYTVSMCELITNLIAKQLNIVMRLLHCHMGGSWGLCICYRGSCLGEALETHES